MVADLRVDRAAFSSRHPFGRPVAAILVPNNGDGLSRHGIDEIGIPRVVVRGIGVVGLRIERIPCVGPAVNHLDAFGPFAGFRIRIDLHPHSAEVEQPAAGPFGNVGIE